MSVTFDTLAYAKKLKAAGVPEKVAEVHAEALAGIVEERLATKQDIAALKHDLEGLELRLKTELTRDMAEVKAGILKWVAGMLVAQAAIVATLVKLL